MAGRKRNPLSSADVNSHGPLQPEGNIFGGVEDLNSFVESIVESLVQSSDDEDGESSQRTHQSVLSATDPIILKLQCPACKQLPVPPIRICPNGHFSCNNCVISLAPCIVCQAQITNTRNIGLESVIKSLKVGCKYQGCEAKLRGTKYQQHLRTCPYGNPICNELMSTTCESREIERDDYITHLVHCHQARGVNLDPGTKRVSASFNQRLDDFPPLYIAAVDRRQVFFVFTRKCRSYYCWWVTSFQPEDITRSIVRLTLSSKGNEEASSGVPVKKQPYGIQWTLPIHSMQKSFEEIRDSGECGVVPETHIQLLRKIHFQQQKDDDFASPVEWKLSLTVLSTENLKIINRRNYFQRSTGRTVLNIATAHPFISIVVAFALFAIFFNVVMQNPRRF